MLEVASAGSQTPEAIASRRGQVISAGPKLSDWDAGDQLATRSFNVT